MSEFTPFSPEDVLPSQPQAGGPDQMPGPPLPIDPSTYDLERVLNNLVTDRSVKLSIPKHLMHPDYQYRFVNNVPGSLQKWMSEGFTPATHPDLVALYSGLHGGVTKEGQAYGVTLMVRHKAAGERIIDRHRKQYFEQQRAINPAVINPFDMPAGVSMAQSESKFDASGFGIGMGMAGTASPEAVEHMRKMRDAAQRQSERLTKGRGALD